MLVDRLPALVPLLQSHVAPKIGQLGIGVGENQVPY